MIEGLIKTPLRQIVDERGKVMHMLKATDNHFQEFGEVYFSWINPGKIKAWHKHLKMTLNYAVPVGCMQLVLYDDRPTSNTKGEVNEILLSSDDYFLLTIPPNIWYGMRCIGQEPTMVVNCATLPHDPLEGVRLDPLDHSIPYNWNI